MHDGCGAVYSRLVLKRSSWLPGARTRTGDDAEEAFTADPAAFEYHSAQAAGEHNITSVQGNGLFGNAESAAAVEHTDEVVHEHRVSTESDRRRLQHVTFTLEEHGIPLVTDGPPFETSDSATSSAKLNETSVHHVEQSREPSNLELPADADKG